MRLALVVAIALGALGCGARAEATPVTAPPSPAPRVVVVAVFDQLGSDTLARELPHLDPQGAIRRSIARGRYVHRARYRYSATLTAAGHAAIHSGAPPRESGIGSNNVLSPGLGRRVSALDDGRHAVWGREGAHASPSLLRAETVADVIQRERPEAVVVALGMKDRAAILPGGQHPDLCLWFDARAGGFTSSSWYGEGPPAWLLAFRDRDRFEARMSPPWSPLDPVGLDARLGPDDAPGEGAYGYGATFPHDAHGLDDPDAFLSLPASTEHLLSRAREVVAQLAIGRDHTTDLLAISIAATDYVGHAFGPTSWEYADVLARSDRALGAFLAELEDEVGPVSVVITSDHGVAPLVERAHAEGHPDAVRMLSERMLPELEAHLAATLGPPSDGPWAAGWVLPYVYLTPREPAVRARVMEATLAWLRGHPGIAIAADAHDVAARPVPDEGESIESLVARSIPPSPPGDIYIMAAERSVATEELPEGRGTSHGSVWSYDREVPLIVVDPRVARGESEDAVPQCWVAGTIAALAGVRPPEHACGSVL